MFNDLSTKDLFIAGSIFIVVLIIGGMVSALLLLPYLTPNTTGNSGESISRTLTARATLSAFQTVVAQATQIALQTSTPMIPVTVIKHPPQPLNQLKLWLQPKQQNL
jgi:hypothetical protein